MFIGVLTSLLMPALSEAQNNNLTEAAARRQRIQEMERTLNKLKTEERLSELRAKRDELDAQIRQAGEDLAAADALAPQSSDPQQSTGSTGTAGGSPQNPPSGGTPGAGTGTGGGATASTSPTPAPADTATLPPPDQRGFIRSIPEPLSSYALNLIDTDSAQLADAKYARLLILNAIKNNVWAPSDLLPVNADGLGAPNPDAKDFHCIIHVLRWGKDGKVDKQNWYIYSHGEVKGFNGKWSYKDFATNDRLFGTSKVWLLYVHLNNLGKNYYQVRYDFEVRKKLPAPVADLFSVLQLFTSAAQAAGEEPLKNVWGGGSIKIDYVPSDMTVTANILPSKVTVEQNRVTNSEVTGPVVAIEKPKTFDNEGLYWWDVSVGIPFRHISQITFDNTSNTVAPKEVTKQNLFALLNLYPIRTDVKTQNFTWIPHFVGGVAIAKKPQDKILLGAGFGPYFANFYLGALFVKQQEKAAAGSAQLIRTHYKPQFTLGLNLPVRGIKAALEKKK
jgi:hypothetical protein